jgi:hypothetical protein
VTDDVTLADIRAIVRDELRRALVERRRVPLCEADYDQLTDVLPIVVGLLGSDSWTVRDVYALTGEPRAMSLRAALGAVTARQFGKRLRRACDVDIEGYMVTKVGDSGRDGALWRVLIDLHKVA